MFRKHCACGSLLGAHPTQDPKTYQILARHAQNRFGLWGSAQTPLKSLRRSPDPIIARSFLPSAIAASRLLTYMYSHVLIGTPSSISSFPFQAPLTQFLDPHPPVGLHEVCGKIRCQTTPEYMKKRLPACGLTIV